MQLNGLSGSSVVLESRRIESDISLQVEAQINDLAMAIIATGPSTIVRRKSGTHSERGISCYPSSSYSSAIVSDGRMVNERFTSEVVIEASSPGPCYVARDRAVRDADFAIVKNATAMLGLIPAGGAVGQVHFTPSSIIEAPA